MGISRQTLVVTFTKRESALKGKARVAVDEQLFVTKKKDRAIFIHGFAKNEKSNLSKNELNALKELAKILLALSSEKIKVAIKNGDFVEVKS
jgi:hypothetical protein